MTIKIRFVTSEDWLDVKRIYEAGIDTKMATFESRSPESYNEWFGEAIPTCSFVALEENKILASENEGFWTLESKIFKENIASLKLHEKNGFRIVGIREKIALLDGDWKDNVLMERRRTMEPIVLDT